MGVNSLPKTVTRQRRDCGLNPGPSVPESSTLTTRIPSHPVNRQPVPLLITYSAPKRCVAIEQSADNRSHYLFLFLSAGVNCNLQIPLDEHRYRLLRLGTGVGR